MLENSEAFGHEDIPKTTRHPKEELRCEDCGPIRPALTLVCPECGKLAEGVEIA